MAKQTITIFQILEDKKRGKELSQEQIDWFVKALTAEEVADYQVTAFLMAAFIQGMSKNETAYLTDAMLYSGKTLKFEGWNVVDKHSTGGIGDKTSFILAPIAASCGVKIPMIAGRSLGFTGGTIDKVESIPGFQTSYDLNDFQSRLKKHGLVLIGQTVEMAPADKILYALRDVTATIDSIPFITASIMSKKLAEGANGIVMDIKCGSGAFMQKKSKARALAKSILDTAYRFNKRSVALITNMNQPLGNNVGHSLEIIESIEVLKGNGPKDLTTLSVELAAHMIHISGIEKSLAKARKRAKASIENGSALKCFSEFIANQGGDNRVINDYSILPLAKLKTPITLPDNGHIKSFQNDQVGFLCTHLGGGRKLKADKIDLAVGFEFIKKIGDKVQAGETIGYIYHHANQSEAVNYVLKQMKSVIKVSSTKVEKPDVIFETIEGKEIK